MLRQSISHDVVSEITSHRTSKPEVEATSTGVMPVKLRFGVLKDPCVSSLYHTLCVTQELPVQG